MIPAILSAFLAAECLASSGDRLPSVTVLIPQDLKTSFALPPAAADVPSVPGIPVGISVGSVIRIADTSQMRAKQVVRVDLHALFNRNLRNSETMGEGREKFYLSTQMNLKGDAFLSVQGEDWANPYFFQITSDMKDSWSSTAGTVYNVSIDGSIFRKKFNNLLVIQDGKTGREVLSRRLSDFFNSSYSSGQTVVIGGNTYKLFYSYSVDSSRYPAVFDKSSTGLCLLYDESKDPGYHIFQSYPIPFESVKGAQPAAYRLHGGQVLYFKLADDQKTLVISD